MLDVGLSDASGLGKNSGDWSAGFFTDSEIVGGRGSFKRRWDNIWAGAEGRAWYDLRRRSPGWSAVAYIGGIF